MRYGRCYVLIGWEFRGEVPGEVNWSGNRLLEIGDYFWYISEYGMKIFVHIKLYIKFARSNKVVAYGVIGNTAGFGPVVLGSSPSRPTRKSLDPDRIKGFLFLGIAVGAIGLKVGILYGADLFHQFKSCQGRHSGLVQGKVFAIRR